MTVIRKEACELARGWIDDAEREKLPFIMIHVNVEGQTKLLSNLGSTLENIELMKRFVEKAMTAVSQQLGN